MVPRGRDRNPAPAKGQDGASTSCLQGSLLCAHQPASALRGQRERGAGSGQGVHLRPSPSLALPGPTAPSSSLPGGHRQPQAPSSAGYRMCAPRHVLRLSEAGSPPTHGHADSMQGSARRAQHAGLSTHGRMSRPGAPAGVLSPWAGGAGPAGGPPDEAEGPQARVVAVAVWAEPVGCLALSHCRGFT